MRIDVADLHWLLGSLCQLNRVPFSAELLAKELPPPHTLPSVLDGLSRLGFEAESRAVRLRAMEKLPAPFVALVNVDAEAPHGPTRPHTAPHGPDQPLPAADTFRLVLIVRAEGGRVLCFAAGSSEPAQFTLEEFGRQYTGRVILYRRREQAPQDPDAVASTGQAFGFRWFLPVLLKHRELWRDVLIASLVIQLIGLATPLFTQVIIDKVIVHQTVSTLVVIGVALVIFMLFGALLTWTRQHLLILVGNRVDAVLGTTVFEHLFRLPLHWFEHRPTGVIAARLHAVETIREFLSGSIVTLLLDIPFLIIFVAMMFWYSVTLTLLVLAILSAVVILSLVVAPLFQKLLNRQFLSGARNQAFMTEYVAGMETVKSLQLEPLLRDRYRELFGDYLAAAREKKNLSNSYNTLAGSLEQTMTLSVLIVGAWVVMSGPGADGERMTIGMLVAFQMFAARVSQPLLRMTGLWQQFQQAKISVERLGDVMNAPAEPYTLTPSRETAGKGDIEFAGLGFRYGDDHPYLYRNFSLKVPAGSTFAVMGPSGSGKSTLAKLLLGFYQPVEGSIRLDGRDLRHLAANELRAGFGVVPQETTLFSGTVYDNLQMANPSATFEDIVKACRVAEIHEVIERLPKGYQTELGERGIGLSGGQRQRMAIARALLKRPHVLIFDEAVSNLDDITTEHFCKTLNQLKGKVTLLFITHQLPKGLNVDGVIRIGGATASAVDPVSAPTTVGPALAGHHTSPAKAGPAGNTP